MEVERTEHPVTEERRAQWLGQEIVYSSEDCEGTLKVNPFVVGDLVGGGSSGKSERQEVCHERVCRSTTDC